MSDPATPGNSDETKSPFSNEKTERKSVVDTPGGQPVEDVEDRPNVSTTTPDKYPEDMRANGVT